MRGEDSISRLATECLSVIVSTPQSDANASPLEEHPSYPSCLGTNGHPHQPKQSDSGRMIVKIKNEYVLK